MTVVVDAAVIARAIGGTDSIRQTPEKPAPARVRTKPMAGSPARANEPSTPNAVTPARAINLATPTGVTPARADALVAIRLLGRTLDDLERLRIMHSNRVGAAVRAGHDVPWVETVEQHLRAVEHQAELELKRAWRKHPLAPWAKAIPGAGETLMARLIAEIGFRSEANAHYDWAPLDAPNPGKLLAYCGHGDPARAGKMPKGATQDELFKRGSPGAKKATWKLAYQFMRTVGHDAAATMGETETTLRPSSRRSPYRDLYDARKTATEGKNHESSCVRCGPAGKPALPGSEWSDAHRHADALRIVGKRFLIDLWVANREVSQ